MFSSKESESSNLLLVELVRKEISQAVNQFKNNCLWLTEENITPEELGKLLGQPTAKIITFFWNKKIFINQNQSLTPDLLNDYCRSLKVGIKPQKKLDFRTII